MFSTNSLNKAWSTVHHAVRPLAPYAAVGAIISISIPTGWTFCKSLVSKPFLACLIIALLGMKRDDLNQATAFLVRTATRINHFAQVWI